MNLVDSSAWLEYLSGSSRAELFAGPIEHAAALIVPVIVVYELFRKIYRERGKAEALEVYALLAQGNVVDVDAGRAGTACSRG